MYEKKIPIKYETVIFRWGQQDRIIIIIIIMSNGSSRTVEIIDAESGAIKVNNPNWLTDIVDKALITALTVEKNQLSPAPATGNYPAPLNFVKLQQYINRKFSRVSVFILFACN